MSDRADPRPRRRPPVAFVVRLLVLVALTAAIGIAYQAVEDFIPYWDYARIERLFQTLAEAFDDGPAAGLEWLRDQVNSSEYNSVFALPLMPVSDLVGASRDRIVLAVLLVHVTLYLVAFGFLLRKVLGLGSLDEVGLLPLGAALLLPSVFTATMLGFETVAVLPVLTVAVTLFLAASWPDGAPTTTRRMALFALAGGLLAATFLIRRAYAYTVISFYATAGLVLLAELVLGRLGWRSREARVRVAGLAAAGAGSLAVLLGIARDRVLSVLATPYHELYAAWKISSLEAYRQLLSSVGGIVLVAAAVGFLVGRRALPAGRRIMADLLGLTAAVGFAQWIFLVRLRMRLDKPMLYAPMIALGIALLLGDRAGRRWAGVVRVVVVVLLVANLGASLGALPGVEGLRRVVVADPLPPLTRDDMDEFRDLVSWLRAETTGADGRGEPILVLAATGDLNDSLVKEAEIAFFGWGDQRLDVPPFNTVDRTSNYPVWLHRAEWVVLARPFQFHTSAEERRLLRFAWDELVERRGVARNFERIDRRWVLGRRAKRPVRVEVWRRVRDDSPTELLDLLDRSKAFVIHHPVFPDLWVEDGPLPGFFSDRLKREGEVYRLHLPLPAGRLVSSATLMAPLDGGVGVVVKAAPARGRARGAELVAELLDVEALRAGVEEVVLRRALAVEETVRLELETPTGATVLLRLGVERPAAKAPALIMADVEIAGQSR
ncbi:MAG: hypothetical protein MUC56_18145 [Thermoanaerobaculales bacterium]|jgi:hypothetical protein|nr:hypothetical protein [Thermoanaerobaculales bacterium]